MLDDTSLRRVKTIGLGLRLTYALTGGMPGILEKAKLDMGEKTVILSLPSNEPIFDSGSYPKRLSRLASHLDCSEKLESL